MGRAPDREQGAVGTDQSSLTVTATTDDRTRHRRNAVLGEDYDTAVLPERELSPERVAQQIVAYFIPFRGVIREVSGANRHEYEFRQAISAGLMRRAYLKGRGEQMGCAYPARPYPSPLVSDPANFEDLGDPPPEQPPDPRQVANVEG